MNIALLCTGTAITATLEWSLHYIHVNNGVCNPILHTSLHPYSLLNHTPHHTSLHPHPTQPRPTQPHTSSPQPVNSHHHTSSGNESLSCIPTHLDMMGLIILLRKCHVTESFLYSHHPENPMSHLRQSQALKHEFFHIGKALPRGNSHTWYRVTKSNFQKASIKMHDAG